MISSPSLIIGQYNSRWRLLLDAKLWVVPHTPRNKDVRSISHIYHNIINMVSKISLLMPQLNTPHLFFEGAIERGERGGGGNQPNTFNFRVKKKFLLVWRILNWDRRFTLPKNFKPSLDLQEASL